MNDDDPPGTETTLDANRQVHLGIWRDEHTDLTRRFFRWDVPELSDVCVSAIGHGVREDLPGLDLSTIGGLLEPGHLPIETGIARTPEGGIGVAVWTAWPGTTATMIDWWFGWHLSRTERYKLWHPQAHLFAQPRFERSDLEGLTDRERYLGNTSWVDEYVGPFVSRLAITFIDPAELGLSHESLGPGGSATAVCARVDDSDSGAHLAVLVHAVRATAWGSEMRSRFVFPPGTPDLVGAPMLDHCFTEMTHLAGFLPHLHAAAAMTGPEGH
jgi:hypothetical protein